MKSLLFAAALLAGTAAVAQTADSGMQAQPDPAMAPAMTPTPSVVAPGNTDPATDQAGTPVVSDPALAPAGFNRADVNAGTGGPYVPSTARPAPQPATQDYPACSRTVTDHCVQTYERGARRPR